ncbi:hypothetical protein CFOL_v3_01290, partial [Cephalotus follicularis]
PEVKRQRKRSEADRETLDPTKVTDVCTQEDLMSPRHELILKASSVSFKPYMIYSCGKGKLPHQRRELVPPSMVKHPLYFIHSLKYRFYYIAHGEDSHPYVLSVGALEEEMFQGFYLSTVENAISCLKHSNSKQFIPSPVSSPERKP